MASLRKELSTIPYFSDTKNQNASIGTVHTFQGKEAHTVIFVTGLDDTCNGAINWLIQKPNLLNVAVTRAKERFLLVGDYELLHERDHFKKFGESLKVIEGASLLTSHIVI